MDRDVVQLPRQFLQPLLSPAAEHQPPAAGGELFGAGPAETGGCSGNDDRFCHLLSPC